MDVAETQAQVTTDHGEIRHQVQHRLLHIDTQVAHLRAHAFGLTVPPHGECEYCEGGNGYDALMRSVAQLKTVKPDTTVAPRAFLPMAGAQDGAAAAGCGSGGCARRPVRRASV